MMSFDSYEQIPKHLLRSARIKFLCEIGDLMPPAVYDKAAARIWEMPEEKEDRRPE